VLHLLLTCKVGKFTKKKKKENGRDGGRAYFARRSQLGQSRGICVSVQHSPNVINRKTTEKVSFVLHTLKRSTTSLSVFCMTPDFHPTHTHTHIWPVFILSFENCFVFKRKEFPTSTFSNVFENQISNPEKIKFKFHILTSHKLNFIQLAPKLNSKWC
jgi:hypothetical protein